jgi:hypothetical protein
VLRAFLPDLHPAPSSIVEALWRAEHGDLPEVEAALVEFDRLPALTIRKILGSYADHWKYAGPKRERKSDARM